MFSGNHDRTWLPKSFAGKAKEYYKINFMNTKSSKEYTQSPFIKNGDR